MMQALQHSAGNRLFSYLIGPRVFPLLLAFFCLGTRSFSQNSDSTSALWQKIEARLDQSPNGTDFEFICQLVQVHCGNDYGCLRETYNRVMKNLEKKFNLPAAAYIGEIVVKLAQKHKDLHTEALAYNNLSRFYNAMGFTELDARCVDNALRCAEQLGDNLAITKLEFRKLTQSLNYRSINEVLPQMNALLDAAIKNQDTLAINWLHLCLIEHTVKAKHYDEALKHIEAVEQIPISIPISAFEYGSLILTNTGRATLAMERNDLVEAERYYQQALHFTEEEPSHWLNIKTLHSLTKLEWKRNDKKRAKTYLEIARKKANALELHDLLANNYALQSEMAEAEGRYKEALAYSKQELQEDSLFKKGSAGFNVQTYYLNMEKERLTTENRNKALELQINKVQLLIAIVVIFSVVVLAGFFIFFYRQQKSKSVRLSAQNALIQQQSTELQSLDAAKSRFFANISHELRTPLTLMLGPVNTLLKESQLAEKQTRLLQLASRNGRQLEVLINDILDLRKLEMGKMTLDEKPVGLFDFFQRHCAQFESMAEARQIDFSFEINLDKALVTSVDPEKCRQLLSNLLSNAFKFTPKEGWITVKVALHTGALQLQVADSGPGIHPDDLPHVFDRFFQTTLPNKAIEGGTGIGLNLCQEYAKLFGGSIQVESTLGEGSVFRVQFPVSVASDVPAANSASVPAIPALDTMDKIPSWSPAAPYTPVPAGIATAIITEVAKPNILVVEDNLDLQEYLRLTLGDQYQVISAENGLAAWEYLQTDKPRPSLILSDLMMPVMDGYQLLEKLKSTDATRHLPVIMLTARADAKDKLKALRIGVDDYLTKPFDEEELLVRIENLLKNQSVRQQESAVSIAQTPDIPLISQEDQEWLEGFEAFVARHLRSDLISVALLTQEFAMSESTLLRQLKRLTGFSPQQYVQEMRLDAARQMLESNQYNSIQQVADKVGYADARAFARRFKARFGKLPSDLQVG